MVTIFELLFSMKEWFAAEVISFAVVSECATSHNYALLYTASLAYK